MGAIGRPTVVIVDKNASLGFRLGIISSSVSRASHRKKSGIGNLQSINARILKTLPRSLLQDPRAGRGFMLTNPRHLENKTLDSWRDPLEEYWLPIRPVPKSNPFFGRGVAMTLAKDKQYQREVELEIRSQRGPEQKLTKSVELVAYFGFKRPKKSKLPTPRPDVDNLAKNLLDAVKRVCIEDDTQVSRLTVEKGWESDDIIVVQLFDRPD